MKSNKQRRAELRARRAARQAAVDRQARLDQHDAEQAKGLPVDLGVLRRNGSYTIPDFVARGYYLDKPFICRGCGVDQVWTAAQQKWWYEVALGDTSTGAGYCRPCRRQRRIDREQAAQQPPRHPYKSPQQVLARVELSLRPALQAAGFNRVSQKGQPRRQRDSIDFERADALLTLTTRPGAGRLTAQVLQIPEGELQEVATTELVGSHSPADIEAWIADFVTSIQLFLAAAGGPEPDRSAGG